MSKKLGDKSDFRVVCYPHDSTWVNRHNENDRWAAKMQSICEDVQQEIRRHVDGYGHTIIEFDQAEVCAHCGAKWTEYGSDYNGGCCDADEAAQDVRRNAVCAKVFGTQTP